MSIWVDGSGWNGKRSAWLIVLEDGRKIRNEVDTQKTNNETEYLAAILATEYAEPGEVIYTDSALVVGQILHGWKINHEHLRTLNKELLKRLLVNDLILKWIPRAENKAGKVFEKDP
jgi:ribonuclease HI